MRNIFIVKMSSFLYILFSLFFILIATFRGMTRDTDVYKEVYNNILYYPLGVSEFYSITGMELGYGVLAYPFKYLDLPFIIFLFFFSFLTFFFIGKAANNFKINSFFVLICYFPVFFANHQLMQIRQGLAVATVYFALSILMSSEKKVKAYLFFTFSVFFHNVAFVFLLFLSKKINTFIANKKYFIMKIIFIFIFTIIFCRFITLFDFLTITDRIANYSGSEYAEERSIFHPVNIRAFLLLVLFVLFRLKDSIIYNFLLLLNTIGVAIRFGFYDFLILSGRLSTIFTFSEIFLISFLLCNRMRLPYAYLFLFLYFIFSLYLNLVYQVPFIIDDYFKPLR